MRYRQPCEPPNGCGSCIAWYAEAQRAGLLLELLAEDHFPDQPAFDAWINRQIGIALNRDLET